MIVHTCDSGAQEAEAGGFESLIILWTMEKIPGQPGLHRESVCQNRKD